MTEEIDSRVPYRVGCPKLPVLPVETRARHQTVETYFPNFDHHISNTRRILAKHNIPDCGILFAPRVNRGVATADHHLTLVLLSQYENGCQDYWVKAVREIRSNLLQSGIHWAIELIDEQVFGGPLHTSPILSTDRNLIDGWSRVLPTFLSTIDNHNWAAIDVLYREFPSRGMQPTVIISAVDANDDAWWNSTLPAVYQLLQDKDFEVEILLLFSNGVRLTMNGPSNPEDFTPEPSTEAYPEIVEDSTSEPRTKAHDEIIEDFYEDKIYIGTSCTTSGFDHSGTLGGRIKLQKDSTILELGLTNYHVLKDAFMVQGSTCGPFPPDANQPYGIAVSPSDSDDQVEVNRLKEYISKLQAKHDESRLNLQYLTDDDPNLDLKTELLATLGTTLHSNQRRLYQINHFPRRVGHVYAASGYRTCEDPRYRLEKRKDWALDWCLVQVDQPRSISCRLYNVPPTGYYIQDKVEVNQYCTISVDEHYKVVKRGRTSGWTRGTISAIGSVVRVQGNFEPSLILPSVQKAKFKEKWGGKAVLVHGIVGTKENPQFIQAGDSGSLILLDQSSNIPGVSIIGLGFAGNDNTSASYMLPMDLIVKDIEEVTGAKVIEPRYAGQVSVISN